MSESDSDLAFESADEDSTEHTCPKESIFNKDESPEHLPEMSNIESGVAATTSGDNKSSDISRRCVPSGDNKSSDIRTQLEKIDLSQEVEERENNLGQSNNEISNSSPKDFNDESDIKPEARHVPLRLEKKIQQKKQSTIKNVEDINTEQDGDTNKCENNPSIAEKKSSWGFSSWGTSLLSTAASSVSTFSSQVTQGIGTVFETVENTLGAPPPEELAAALQEKKEETGDNTAVESSDKEVTGILPDVSAWTKALENTGSKVLMGGLDTLELIGKKTMDILTEADPGLKSTRNVFSDGISLSQILREAKERAEEDASKNESENFDVINYSQVFDDEQGLIHLEALEMLSRQTQVKFQRLLMSYTKKAEIKSRLEEIKSICEHIPSLDDSNASDSEEDFESVFGKHTLELSLPLNTDNIVKTQKKLNEIISNYENTSEEPFISPDDIFRTSICSLAEFTARCIETFHKIAELILVEPKKLGSYTEKCATHLTGLTTVMCVEINNLSSRLHKCLDSSDEHFPNFVNPQGLNITAMVTNLYVEASNSNKYIQDAFQMLVPVLQICLLESLNE